MPLNMGPHIIEVLDVPHAHHGGSGCTIIRESLVVEELVVPLLIIETPVVPLIIELLIIEALVVQLFIMAASVVPLVRGPLMQTS